MVRRIATQTATYELSHLMTVLFNGLSYLLTELFNDELSLGDSTSSLRYSVALRKASMPCFPQCNHAHENFKVKLCPALDGSRARPAQGPRRHLCRTQSLTQLAFVILCSQIYCYCENAGIRTLPYFQTYTLSDALSDACHTNCNL